MQPIHPFSKAASVALLAFPFQALAQSTYTNTNLTLRFFQTPQDDTCSFTNNSSALTFTTSSTPIVGHCFDFATLFGGNTTQGFANQSQNIINSFDDTSNAGIHWQLENLDTYDPQGNYSSLLYRQHLAFAIDDEDKPGHYANLLVNIFPSKGCSELDPKNSSRLLPWYGFTCWSENEGKCGTTEYPIGSFYVWDQDREEKEKDSGDCYLFARMGASARVSASLWGAVGAVVGTVFAVCVRV
ncbi:hypothetical protein PtrSN002B_011146 [Pyrenophora tritici-repentis]|uniref:Uncharacterized protein n=2 Tax=Pyrenophora tritici-repentis TaxID=45151 RepID=A0A2W1DJB3_9PLEO|nr:hypothetical protein PtrV1_04910 [Pyrenophora tritici-repentis]KAF7452611.1 hypothetical protein A1F99_043890 [Pyrenophora tritici-repentis]KAG9386943.1 hypothetical protein A1F94_003693 [Pyrenophora tritici-repentis]KAI0570118.1 hypothetical protein Alg215_11255 [Pyrenophora tritici-repentis]KAI0573065.1 hypothetical protein Alg130_10248 [Pyrenophora tritici-repentis]